jgi:late competence protein required for DNA uptake (superfamily II DNA/RNA helicase)
MNFHIENPKEEFDKRGEYFRNIIINKNQIIKNGTDKEKQKMEKLNEKYNKSVYCNHCGHIEESRRGLFRIANSGFMYCQSCYDLYLEIREL